MSKQKSQAPIYLAHTGSDTFELHRHVHTMLSRAGLQVICASDVKKQELDEIGLKCSVHIIGNKLGEENKLKMMDDLNYANSLHQHDPAFTIFVWHPKKQLMLSEQKEQDSTNILNTVRNSILSNTVFSTHDSPVMFVEDLRSLLFSVNPTQFHTKNSDLFFIYNTIDYITARETIDLLSDIAKIEVLKIDSNSQANYSDYIVQQINRSKLTVVFYDKAKDWSLPFIQQIWKNSGGASVPGYFLLIGSSQNEEVHTVNFDAPKAIVKSVPVDMIPLEIKVELDKLQQYEQ